jgi:hypothetical protein
MVLHRNDRGHDERGTFCSNVVAGGAAVRFLVEDPDAMPAVGGLGSTENCLSLCSPKNSYGAPRIPDEAPSE